MGAHASALAVSVLPTSSFMTQRASSTRRSKEMVSHRREFSALLRLLRIDMNSLLKTTVCNLTTSFELSPRLFFLTTCSLREKRTAYVLCALVPPNCGSNSVIFTAVVCYCLVE